MTIQANHSAGILMFLPMLYVAWSDAVLSPSEIKMIQEKMGEISWLTESETKVLNGWLNPQSPPSAREMQHWRALIKKCIASSQFENHNLDLVELSLAMAQLAESGTDLPNNPATKKALETLENDLGIIGGEMAREHFQAPRPPIGPPVASDAAPSFSPTVMADFLKGEHKPLRNKIRKLLLDPFFDLSQIPESKDDFRELVFNWTQALAEQGWGSAGFPKEHGGEDDFMKYIVVFEELGYHDLSLTIKFGVQFGLWGGSVFWLGTEKHHKKYLKAIGDFSLPGSFAMTESGHGSNVRDILTTATYDESIDAFILHTPEESARKEYIGNAACHAKAATVFAQLVTKGEEHGVHAFVVPLRDDDGNCLKGIRIEDNGRKLGLNGVDNGRIWFDQVVVPREELLDRFASVDQKGNYSSPINSPTRRFFTMLGTLVGGRVCVPMAGLSAAKSALSIAIKYANKRKQFGPPGGEEMNIMGYPSHQRRLLPYLAKAYALDAAHKYLVERFLNKTEEDEQEIESIAAGLKSVSTWNTTETIQSCREACGGNGYLWENRFADLKADSEIFTTFEGDNVVLLQLVAKARLSHFKKQFGHMGFMSTVKFVADIAGTALSELNPLIIRKTDEEHLLDEDFHLHAISYRESYLLRSSAMRLSKRIKGGTDSFVAFLETQNQLLEMAQAYIDKMIVQEAYNKLKKAPSALQATLKKVYQLHALKTIENNKAWYLENDYMEGRKAIAITKLIDKLCAELAPISDQLVEAFDIPDAVLKAPIAISYQ